MRKTKLITADIIKLVKSALKGDHVIIKYDVGQFDKFMIGNYIVTIKKGEKPVINLGDNQSSEYFKIWREDVGGILLKELRKDDSDLFEMKSSKFKVSLKKIREDEYLDFCNKKMDHVMIGNENYTIIKAVPTKKGYGDKTDDYSLEFDDEDEIKKAVKETHDEVEVDDEPITANSYALF
jgi:hypothetical protein